MDTRKGVVFLTLPGSGWGFVALLGRFLAIKKEKKEGFSCCQFMLKCGVSCTSEIIQCPGTYTIWIGTHTNVEWKRSLGCRRGHWIIFPCLWPQMKLQIQVSYVVTMVYLLGYQLSPKLTIWEMGWTISVKLSNTLAQLQIWLALGDAIKVDSKEENHDANRRQIRMERLELKVSQKAMLCYRVMLHVVPQASVARKWANYVYQAK